MNNIENKKNNKEIQFNKKKIFFSILHTNIN